MLLNRQGFIDNCDSYSPEKITQKVESNPLLLKANRLPPRVLAQLIVKSAFLGVQPRKRPCFRLSINSPEWPMSQECLLIHEK